MKALLLVAGIAAAVALASGLLLLRATPGGGAAGTAPPGAAGSRADRRLDEFAERIARLEERLAAAEARAAGAPAVPVPAPPAGGPSAKGEAVEANAAAPGSLAEVGSPEGMGLLARVLESSSTGRDPEIRRFAARAAEAIGLGDGERLRYEEILRGHAEKCDALAARAREALKDTLHGWSPAEKAAMALLEQERKKLDAETQQALSDLVGRERWQKNLQAEKDQQAKERALQRLEKPW